jgi:hypothetical protein
VAASLRRLSGLDYVCGAYDTVPAKHACRLVAADLHGDILSCADQVAYGRSAQDVDDEPFISVPDVS